jgi:hypothetical protein
MMRSERISATLPSMLALHLERTSIAPALPFLLGAGTSRLSRDSFLPINPCPTQETLDSVEIRLLQYPVCKTTILPRKRACFQAWNHSFLFVSARQENERAFTASHR